MDLSSECVHSLLPIFPVSTLGASVITIGVIEGVAEASALITKVFSGAVSDYFQRRKALLLLDYGMAALAKPLFPLATSAEAVFSARFLEYRQGYSRGPARRAGCGYRARGDSRCVLRSSSIDGYGWGVFWPVVSVSDDAFPGQRH